MENNTWSKKKMFYFNRKNEALRKRYYLLVDIYLDKTDEFWIQELFWSEMKAATFPSFTSTHSFDFLNFFFIHASNTWMNVNVIY